MPNIKFLIAAPLRKLFSDYFSENASDILSTRYKLKSDNQNIHGKTIKLQLGKHYLNLYAFHNITEFHSKEWEFYQLLIRKRELYEKDISKYYEDTEHLKYFLIKPKKNSKSGEYTVELNRRAIAKHLKNRGKMVLLGNDNDLSITEALEIYRAKDIVEKGFLRFKSNMDMIRMRVHSSRSMHNREFVCFLAQILLSYFDYKMSSNGWYKRYSLRKVLGKFKPCKMKIISGRKILNPLSKAQKDILNSFNVTFPEVDYVLLE
jgi:transposase